MAAPAHRHRPRLCLYHFVRRQRPRRFKEPPLPSTGRYVPVDIGSALTSGERPAGLLCDSLPQRGSIATQNNFDISRFSRPYAGSVRADPAAADNSGSLGRGTPFRHIHWRANLVSDSPLALSSLPAYLVSSHPSRGNGPVSISHGLKFRTPCHILGKAPSPRRAVAYPLSGRHSRIGFWLAFSAAHPDPCVARSALASSWALPWGWETPLVQRYMGP